jgi:hypothetical protein
VKKVKRIGSEDLENLNDSDDGQEIVLSKQKKMGLMEQVPT